MSKKPKNESLKNESHVLPQDNPTNSTSQAESDVKQAEILHEDGSTEAVMIRAERSWSGVLPRPEDFAKYADIVPDAPERILRMAEAEQGHRISVEKDIISSNDRGGTRGQWLGFFVTLSAMLLAVLGSVYFSMPTSVSLALVGVPVLSVARSLVLAFKKREDE